MLIYGILFIASVALLLVSTHFTVLLGEKISRVLRISPLIVATTVVAVGTSLPELVLSLTAVAAGDGGLAMGNIVGSNILNVLLVFPVAILFSNLRVGTRKTQMNANILCVVTAFFILFQTAVFPNVIAGAFLLCAACVITYYEYVIGKHGSLHEDIELFIDSKKEAFTKMHVIALVVALLWVMFSAIIVVVSVEAISLVTGLSTTLLGLTLTAMATSMPELFVTISARKKRQEKIALGNIIGSNIYNLLLVAGLINLFSVQRIPLTSEWIFLVGSTVAFVALIKVYKGKIVPKFQGFLLMMGGMLYLWFVFM